MDLFFPVQVDADGLYGFLHSRLFLVLLLASKRLDIFFPLVAQDVILRVHRLFSPPPKGRCVGSRIRMYSHPLLLFSQRSHTY